MFQTLHRADPCLGNGKPGPTRESAERRRAGRGRVRRPRFSFMLKLQRTTNVFVNKEQPDPLTGSWRSGGWAEATGRGTQDLKGNYGRAERGRGGRSNPETRGPGLTGLRCHGRGGAAQDEPRGPNYNDYETDLRDPRSGTRVGAEVSSLQLLSELPTRSVFRRGGGGEEVREL